MRKNAPVAYLRNILRRPQPEVAEIAARRLFALTIDFT
jgi:hypothetical protein